MIRRACNASKFSTLAVLPILFKHRSELSVHLFCRIKMCGYYWLIVWMAKGLAEISACIDFIFWYKDLNKITFARFEFFAKLYYLVDEFYWQSLQRKECMYFVFN